MAKVRRIRDHVPLVVPEDVRALGDPRSSVLLDEDLHTEVVRDELDLEALDQLVEVTMRNRERYDTSMDAAMAVELHRILPLSRREAADRRLWAWLGWVHYPHFVAWRWRPSGRTSLRSADRFAGDRVRQTFARLWWAAELTVKPGPDYALTDRLLGLNGFQDVYEAIFGRAFSQYLPAMESFVEVVGNRPEQIVRDTAKEFGYLLTTLVLETMDADHLKAVLAELVGIVESRS